MKKTSKSTNNESRLRLKRRSIRILDSTEMAMVNGGAPTVYSLDPKDCK